jgi:hypothetical protein
MAAGAHHSRITSHFRTDRRPTVAAIHAVATAPSSDVPGAFAHPFEGMRVAIGGPDGTAPSGLGSGNVQARHGAGDHETLDLARAFEDRVAHFAT